MCKLCISKSGGEHPEAWTFSGGVFKRTFFVLSRGQLMRFFVGGGGGLSFLHLKTGSASSLFFVFVSRECESAVKNKD